jgi:hypothetical protein
MVDTIRRFVIWIRWVLAGRPTARVALRFHPPHGGIVEWPPVDVPLPATALLALAQHARGEVVEVRAVLDEEHGWRTWPAGYERAVAGMFQTDRDPLPAMYVTTAKVARGVKSLAEMRAL